MGLDVNARTFNSLISLFRTLALPHVVLTFVHLRQSLQFLSNHREINELLGHTKVRLAPVTFSVLDLLILISSLMTLFLKGKLNYSQYLTDSENCIYRFVIKVSFLSSCGILAFAIESLFSDQITAPMFHQKLLNALRTYPLGPTKQLVDLIQFKYSCCGAENATDWFSIDWYSRKGNWANDDVPFSCCSNALGIPCIHLNLKRHTYYVKYNSSAPTIWAVGCVNKFTEVYVVDYEWLIYFGIFVGVFSLSMALLDRMLQTADNTFCYNKTFRLRLLTMDPPWKKLVKRCRDREKLAQAQNTVGSKPCSVKRSIVSIISRFRNRNQRCRECKFPAQSKFSCTSWSPRSLLSFRRPTIMPVLLSPGESFEVRRRERCVARWRETSSVTSMCSGSVINEPSGTSSNSGRKRKLDESLPLAEKRIKKLN